MCNSYSKLIQSAKELLFAETKSGDSPWKSLQPFKSNEFMPVGTSRLNSWSDVVGMYRKGKTKLFAVRKKQGIPLTDDEAQIRWPARNSNDLGLRRCRYTDLFLMSQSDPVIKETLEVLNNCDFDYITVCNLTIAAIIYGYEWFDRWNRLGAFATNIEDMTECFKSVSNMMKNNAATFENWWYYVECTGMTGYRNLPFPGFDYVKEVHDLANGGEEHWWSKPGSGFEERVHQSLMRIPTKWNPKMTLLEFIYSRKWETSGASSIGHYEVETEVNEKKELVRIKCRKNMVIDVYTPEELYQLCMNATNQSNYVIVKNELGKVRLAVGGDFPMYIVMLFIAYCASDFDNLWEGVVSGETVSEQIDRLNTMVLLCLYMYGLPYDYKGFDHQPETTELQTVSAIGCKVGSYNVKDPVEYAILANNMIASFDKSTLLSKPGTGGWKEKIELKVKGGLMSGIYLTAKIGNGWNKVVTDIVIWVCVQLGLSEEEIVKYLKGDDTSIYHQNPRVLQLIEWIYRQMNIKAAPGKFSIIKGNNEFLRTWMKDRCYGYPSRVIPGLMQRKPWSNTPWSGSMVLDAIYSDVQIIRRRIVDQTGINKFWEFISNRWCQLHGIPSTALLIPKNLGGLGVGIWDGRSSIYPKIKQIPKLALKLTNSNGFRAAELRKEVKIKYNLDISITTAEEVANAQISGNIVSDDVLSVAKNLRERWKSNIKHTKYIIKTTKHRLDRTTFTTGIRAPMDFDGIVDIVTEQNSSTFGSLKFEVNELLKLKPILKQIGMTIKSALLDTNWFPRLKLSYGFESDPHIGEFLDWYGGNVTVSTYSMNPLLTGMFTAMLTHKIAFVKRRGNILNYVLTHLSGVVEPTITGWSRYIRTCQW